MGGPGSTRWAMTVTRLSMAGVPMLDVRSLAREGVLTSGTTARVRWDNGASVAVEAVSDRLLALGYRLQLADGAIRPIREVITLTTTPCTFGGERQWFVCPGCDTRRAVLYAVTGLFRCRVCHRLAYPA
jgi:hypothetical protein